MPRTIKIEGDLINSSSTLKQEIPTQTSETITPNLTTVPGTIDITTAQSLLTQLNEMQQKLDTLYKERNSDKATIEELKKSRNDGEQKIQFLEKQAETQEQKYQKIIGELEKKINSKADSSSSTALRTELDTKEKKLTATINQHHTELKRENVNLLSQVTEAKQGLLTQFKTLKSQIESDLQGVKNQHNNHTHVVDSQSSSWCPVTFSPGKQAPLTVEYVANQVASGIDLPTMLPILNQFWASGRREPILSIIENKFNKDVFYQLNGDMRQEIHHRISRRVCPD